jgi:hypothetical protein
MNMNKPPPSTLSIILRLTTYQNAAYIHEQYKNMGLNSINGQVPDVPIHGYNLHSE